jgi:flagellar L-ring protein precursor FlgH
MIWGVALFGMLVTGCAFLSPAPLKNSPSVAKEKITDPPLPATEGSIWNSSISYSLYADVKARNVGDIVTINIVESASASKNATTKTSKNTALDATWSGVLAKITGDWVGNDQKVNFANSFDGEGTTTRNSSLNAYITVRVIQVLPNGNLVIRGSREVQVNNENQFINIQGIIRPQDISSSNVVLSTFVAEAKIELTGQGVVSDKQRVGWFTRILDLIWPF